MIRTPEPDFKSNLIDLIIELEHYKNRPAMGTTDALIFLQLKDLFHKLEAILSARIEGNHTTVLGFMNSADDEDDCKDEDILEITNLIDALNFIDSSICECNIDKEYILEIHKKVVQGLKKEGDNRTNGWRMVGVEIKQSKHVPVDYTQVGDYMDELIEYIGQTNNSKEDLLKIAIAHHRFVWIHPFANGNGRTARLLTYAMLCKKGYINPGGYRLFNPAAIFAGDRNKYYKMLSAADSLDDDGLLSWCEYFLNGIRTEIERTEKLIDRDFVENQILIPAVCALRDNGLITELQSKVLQKAIHKNIIKASDVRPLLDKDVSHVEVAREIKKLKDKEMLLPIIKNGRTYRINLNNKLLRLQVLVRMDKSNLLPIHVDS